MTTEKTPISPTTILKTNQLCLNMNALISICSDIESWFKFNFKIMMIMLFICHSKHCMFNVGIGLEAKTAHRSFMHINWYDVWPWITPKWPVIYWIIYMECVFSFNSFSEYDMYNVANFMAAYYLLAIWSLCHEIQWSNLTIVNVMYE